MSSKAIRLTAAEVYWLPVQTRVPLKFGTETVRSVAVARVKVRVQNSAGQTAEGWGETPLSVQWVWPSKIAFEYRLEQLKRFVLKIANAWVEHGRSGHPIEIGHNFLEELLPNLLREDNKAASAGMEPMPWLAALVCCSTLDQAIHDAYGVLHEVPTYATYQPPFLESDLSRFLAPARDSSGNFRGLFPATMLRPHALQTLPAWHLVGGLDPLDPTELTGTEPQDGYPVLLRDWIKRDGLKCLKIKLRGNDAAWDFERMVRVGNIAIETGVNALSADFNCTVNDPEYVLGVLERLRDCSSEIWNLLSYVEQPFPYELEDHRIDVHTVSKLKPLFLDESAHDWRLIRLGRELGWTGVALKTCKTQTGAILSACWAKMHGLSLMVQDLTNPMLAQVPHVLLAAHVETLMGVETNSMQFYPDASSAEAAVHPGLYCRRAGTIDLSSLGKTGFGYRVGEIKRTLPEPALSVGM